MGQDFLDIKYSKIKLSVRSVKIYRVWWWMASRFYQQLHWPKFVTPFIYRYFRIGTTKLTTTFQSKIHLSSKHCAAFCSQSSRYVFNADRSDVVEGRVSVLILLQRFYKYWRAKEGFLLFWIKIFQRTFRSRVCI